VSELITDFAWGATRQALRREFREELQELRTSLTERLDRLIAVTMRDRTQTADRLADIEERLTRLETR